MSKRRERRNGVELKTKESEGEKRKECGNQEEVLGRKRETTEGGEEKKEEEALNDREVEQGKAREG